MNKEERKKYIFAQLRSLPNATQYVEVTKYIENLEQQVKKQKEVIDKLEKKIKVVKQYDFDKVGRYELLDILEEVE